MNISEFLQQPSTACESLPEFVNNLVDLIPGIERGIARLKRKPDDKLIISEVIYGLLKIGENAERSKLELGSLIANPLKTLLTRVHNEDLVFSDLFAEVVLLALDRLELAVEALSGNRPLTQLKLVELVNGLDRLASIGERAFESDAIQLIEAVTGFRPVLPVIAAKPPTSAIARSSEQVAADLLFFRLLTKQFEVRSPLFKGRRQRLLQLALDTNERGGKPVDPVQLEAAVYMHDIGMMFLPESLWLKVGKLSEEERFLMQVHPTMGAGFLERMEGWQPAAEIVAQHHEMPDGGGYPRRFKGDEICPGAKILSIVDAFEAVTLKHSDRGMSRSVLRAIAEINACDKQFATEWIEPFNMVIRQMLES